MSRCGTCNVVLDGMDAMRAHYGSELHITNVRRRVEGLRPMSAEQLRGHNNTGGHEANVEDAELDTRGNGAAPMFTCTLCKKTFHSVQTLQTHVRSTAHLIRKEQRILARDSEAASMLTTTSLGSAAMGLHRRHNAKLRKAVKEDSIGATKQTGQGKNAHAATAPQDRDEDVSETRCLFCGHLAGSVEANLVHLQRTHDFVIPMRAHCVDEAGLLAYLARKVNGLLCIVCNERTRAFPSLDALRHHMRESGHEKIVLGPEYSAFYDCVLSDFDADSRVRLDGLVRGEGGSEQLVVLGAQGRGGTTKKVLRRREADVPLPRRHETEQRTASRKAILAADNEALAVARREQRELMAERRNEDVELVRRHGVEFQAHQLKVNLRSNKLHPKGYDGNGVFA